MSEPLQRLREIAASAPPAPAELEAYLDKVHTRAYTITDREVAGLKEAGVSEDEIFHQTVAAAVSEGLRRFDAATEAIG